VELEERLLHRKDMESELLALTATMAEVLQQGHGEASSLARDVHATASKAQHVSQRVRRLDTAQANLTATIERIDAVIRCSACTAAVQAARQAQDWEALAERISEYQDMQQVPPRCGARALPAGLRTSGHDLGPARATVPPRYTQWHTRSQLPSRAAVVRVSCTSRSDAACRSRNSATCPTQHATAAPRLRPRATSCSQSCAARCRPRSTRATRPPPRAY
jgi:hypothetical protein